MRKHLQGIKLKADIRNLGIIPCVNIQSMAGQRTQKRQILEKETQTANKPLTPLSPPHTEHFK